MKKLLKKMLRRRKTYSFDKSNQIFRGNAVCNTRIRHLDINIKGKNNKIHIHEHAGFEIKCHIDISGDGNEIFIGNSYIGNFTIIIRNADNCRCTWGDRTTATGVLIVFAESGTNLTIGNDCMLANADIRVSDGHTIYDIKSNRVLNHCTNHVVIGNHCWIGQGCLLTKNAKLCDNIIVGAHSVVTKDFNIPYVIIAGQPAKIIKTGVGFSEAAPSAFGEYYTQDKSIGT